MVTLFRYKFMGESFIDYASGRGISNCVHQGFDNLCAKLNLMVSLDHEVWAASHGEWELVTPLARMAAEAGIEFAYLFYEEATEEQEAQVLKFRDPLSYSHYCRTHKGGFEGLRLTYTYDERIFDELNFQYWNTGRINCQCKLRRDDIFFFAWGEYVQDLVRGIKGEIALYALNLINNDCLEVEV